MADQRKRRAIAHLMAAMATNVSGCPRRGLYHATLAELDRASDAVLLEQALALEQLGNRGLAIEVWSLIRRRNPGMGSWKIVAKVFLHADEKARGRMERWDSCTAERHMKRTRRTNKLAS